MGCGALIPCTVLCYRGLEMEIVKTGNNPISVLLPGSWKCHHTELQGMEKSPLFLQGQRMPWESGQRDPLPSCLSDVRAGL